MPNSCRCYSSFFWSSCELTATGRRVQVHALHLTLMAFLLHLMTTCSAFVLFQIITYRDYLPLLLAEETRKWIPLYRGYNEKVDPTVSNVFSLAFRFGHTSVQPFVSRLDDSFQPLGPLSHVPLHLTFCATWRIIMEGKNSPGLVLKQTLRWRSAGKTHEPRLQKRL